MEKKHTLNQHAIQDAPLKKRKRFSGTVVSSAMKDTAVVSVTRYVKHPKYRKYVRHSKRYKTHDQGNTHPVGSNVVIEETRPISKDKTFRIVSAV